jgi:hypothetical protein
LDEMHVDGVRSCGPSMASVLCIRISFVVPSLFGSLDEGYILDFGHKLLVSSVCGLFILFLFLILRIIIITIKAVLNY